MKPLASWTEDELRAYAAGEFDPHELQESEIQWQPEPTVRLEDVDLLGLTPMEIEPLAFLMQTALRDMRHLVHVAVEQLALAQRQLSQRKQRWPETFFPRLPASPPEPERSRGSDEQDVTRR